MNLKQAYYIKTIAQEGSVTAAAKKLFISQPSLSQMLRQVESELGLPIFNRTVSPMTLTYAGEKYLEAANVILAANDRFESQIREIKQENRGRIRLGISVQRAIQVLPGTLAIFSVQYPNVYVELVERGSAHLEEMVTQRQIDIALAAIEATSPHLAYELIERETIGVLTGKSSPLASRIPNQTPITLEEVKGNTFVNLKPGHSARVVQDKLFRRYGINPRVLLETDTLEVAKRVALETDSCMLCSDIYIDDQVLQKGAFYPLKDYENHRHFYACYPKGEQLPRYAADFIQIATMVLAQKNSGRNRERSGSTPERKVAI